MSQSLSQFYVHIIFSTKNRTPHFHNESVRKQLFKYIAGILKEKNSANAMIGGTSDHIHVLCLLPKTISISELVRELKRSSSKWIKTLENVDQSFSWQNGYAAFSVSKSNIPKVRQYILDQDKHHSKMDYQEELRKILSRHNIEFDERYLWN